MSEERGKRVIKVTFRMMESLLTNGTPLMSNIPDDAVLKDHWIDDVNWTFVFLLESSEWEALGEGMDIPQFDAEVERDKKYKDLDDKLQNRSELQSPYL